jgi:lipopolysaccharide export system protein LptA
MKRPMTRPAEGQMFPSDRKRAGVATHARLLNKNLAADLTDLTDRLYFKQKVCAVREVSGLFSFCKTNAYWVVLITALLCAARLNADTFTFKADKMSGGKAAGREITVLTGNAQVRSDTLLLKADRIEMSGKDNQFIQCIGNVHGTEEEKEIIFTTNSLGYDRKTKIAKLEGDSTLEDVKNEVVAKGRFIEYDDINQIAILQISVRLFKQDMVCRSEYAVYRREAEQLDLSGFPVVYKKSDEFRADKIRVALDTDDVIMEGNVSGVIKEQG